MTLIIFCDIVPMNLIQSMFDLIALPMKDDGPADVIFFFFNEKGNEIMIG